MSRDGRSAAVVNDYGRQGQVIDLRHGRVTMQLDGGDYHPDTVPFSAAFVDVGGRSLLAHRTSWNRLDLSDPRDGALLTARGPTSYRRGEERPEHYLDYFHGALRVSPSHRRIADDGWVWHPIGVVTTWELEPWLADPWESEDGASRGSLCARDYYWDHALCWIDDDVIAVGGIGEDDAWIIDGARIFDASTGRERLAFAGPGGTFFSDGASLYASDEGGLSRWDPRDGHRTGHVPGFRPTHHHRAAGELVSLQGSAGRWTLVRWRGLAQPVVASRR
ncbi:MAG: hypothetical protein R3B72_48145 [Polyangiaceae bacterium]